MRNLAHIGMLVLGWILFSGWGYTGHFIISQNSEECMRDSISGYNTWVSFVAMHSSDADNRKSMDDTEGPKHYIDIDNYPEFNANGFISNSYDSVVIKYGEAFVLEQGTLPWATMAAFDSLTANLKRKNWMNAKLWAADLSHYVADGHMPLHLSANYDGQLTGNKGIHSRYESKMIGQFSSSIRAEGEPVTYINDIQDYVFKYIYRNYPYVDSLLKADSEATLKSGSNSTTAYYSYLWSKTADITTNLFNNATQSFSNLFYTAWMNAGLPLLDSEPDVSSVEIIPFELMSVFPNPTDSILHVQYQFMHAGEYRIVLHDWEGRAIRTIEKGTKPTGEYSIEIDVSDLAAGQYFLIVHGVRYSATQKVLVK